MPQNTPAQGSSPAAQLPLYAWFALGLILALSFVQFWVRTTPVRFACTDDVAFQAIATRGNGAIHIHLTHAAQTQGRFYFATPVLHRALLALYEVQRPWLFSLWRTAAFFLQVGLAAWLAARLLGSPVCGAGVALFIAGTLHIPPTFYPVLSFPSAWIGCSALFAALLCQHSYLQQPRFWSGSLAGALYLVACLMQDFFVLFLPAFVALSLLTPRRGWRALARANLGPLVVATAYAGVYVVFAREFPAVYEGTHLSVNFVAAGKILLRQMAGITPGFELLVNRPPPDSVGPLFRELPEIGRTLGQAPLPDLLLGLCQALGLTWVLARCLHHTSPAARHWPWVLVFAVFLNLPVAFSAKYQTFIFHREYPYVYAFYSFLCLGLAVSGAVVWFGQRPASPAARRFLLCGLGALSLILCVSAQASNHRILQLLLQRFN